VKVSFFAKIREALDCDEMLIELPATIMTVDDVLNHLSNQGDIYRDIFEDRSNLRYALDNEIVSADTAITDKSELAIFPPVTGG